MNIYFSSTIWFCSRYILCVCVCAAFAIFTTFIYIYIAFYMCVDHCAHF